ncbi:hypothetical protein O6H91_05G101900 [Diphasiastrum complanatum]|uniref:Uncharacterized protein n=1 Tax=Diphasiastrum complanatum TaxID=34168 RepID=A0ACC2DRG6_DIPCM|nr:hypothetical protein O6H91_05G101900 [Diphasiastrum complanatum]
MSRLWMQAMTVAMIVPLVWSAGTVVQPDCTDELMKMQGCLAFVQKQVSIPSSDCCTGLLSVHLSSPVCLCMLISSNGALNSTPNIDSKQAMLLPSICKVDTDPSRCPALLSGENPTGASGVGAPNKSLQNSFQEGASPSKSNSAFACIPRLSIALFLVIFAGFI